MSLQISEMEAYVAKRRFQEINTELSIMTDRLFGMGLVEEARKLQLFVEDMRLKAQEEVKKMEEREESEKKRKARGSADRPDEYKNTQEPLR